MIKHQKYIGKITNINKENKSGIINYNGNYSILFREEDSNYSFLIYDEVEFEIIENDIEGIIKKNAIYINFIKKGEPTKKNQTSEYYKVGQVSEFNKSAKSGFLIDYESESNNIIEFKLKQDNNILISEYQVIAYKEKIFGKKVIAVKIETIFLGYLEWYNEEKGFGVMKNQFFKDGIFFLKNQLKLDFKVLKKYNIYTFSIYLKKGNANAVDINLINNEIDFYKSDFFFSQIVSIFNHNSKYNEIEELSWIELISTFLGVKSEICLNYYKERKINKKKLIEILIKIHNNEEDYEQSLKISLDNIFKHKAFNSIGRVKFFDIKKKFGVINYIYSDNHNNDESIIFFERDTYKMTNINEYDLVFFNIVKTNDKLYSKNITTINNLDVSVLIDYLLNNHNCTYATNLIEFVFSNLDFKLFSDVLLFRLIDIFFDKEKAYYVWEKSKNLILEKQLYNKFFDIYFVKYEVDDILKILNKNYNDYIIEKLINQKELKNKDIINLLEILKNNLINNKVSYYPQLNNHLQEKIDSFSESELFNLIQILPNELYIDKFIDRLNFENSYDYDKYIKFLKNEISINWDNYKRKIKSNFFNQLNNITFYKLEYISKILLQNDFDLNLIKLIETKIINIEKIYKDDYKLIKDIYEQECQPLTIDIIRKLKLDSNYDKFEIINNHINDKETLNYIINCWDIESNSYGFELIEKIYYLNDKSYFNKLIFLFEEKFYSIYFIIFLKILIKNNDTENFLLFIEKVKRLDYESIIEFIKIINLNKEFFIKIFTIKNHRENTLNNIAFVKLILFKEIESESRLDYFIDNNIHAEVLIFKYLIKSYLEKSVTLDFITKIRNKILRRSLSCKLINLFIETNSIAAQEIAVLMNETLINHFNLLQSKKIKDDFLQLYNLQNLVKECNGRASYNANFYQPSKKYYIEDEDNIHISKGNAEYIYCEGRFWKSDRFIVSSSKKQTSNSFDFFWCRGKPCVKVNDKVDTNLEFDKWTFVEIAFVFNKKLDRLVYTTIGGWINRMKEIIESLYCVECDSILHPLSKQTRILGHYAVPLFYCPNNTCSKFKIEIRFTHCLKCSKTLDSRKCKNCNPSDPNHIGLECDDPSCKGKCPKCEGYTPKYVQF